MVAHNNFFWFYKFLGVVTINENFLYGFPLDDYRWECEKNLTALWMPSFSKRSQHLISIFNAIALGLLCVDFPSSPYFIEPNTTQHLQFMFSSYTFAAIWSVHVPFCFFYLCFDFSGLGMHVGRSDYFDLVCISKLSFWIIVFLICFLGTYSLFKLTNHFKV